MFLTGYLFLTISPELELSIVVARHSGTRYSLLKLKPSKTYFFFEKCSYIINSLFETQDGAAPRDGYFLNLPAGSWYLDKVPRPRGAFFNIHSCYCIVDIGIILYLFQYFVGYYRYHHILFENY